VYEEGKDYEVIWHYYGPDEKEPRAVPIDSSKGEDELWKELLYETTGAHTQFNIDVDLWGLEKAKVTFDERVKMLKQKFSITKKQ
jgi:hypothetical protein